jgi:hypothetical protein
LGGVYPVEDFDAGIVFFEGGDILLGISSQIMRAVGVGVLEGADIFEDYYLIVLQFRHISLLYKDVAL